MKQFVAVVAVALAACGSDVDEAFNPLTAELPSQANLSVYAPGWATNQDAIAMLVSETESGNGRYDLQGQAELSRPAGEGPACPTAPQINLARGLVGTGIQLSAPHAYTSNGMLICGYVVDQFAWLHVEG